MVDTQQDRRYMNVLVLGGYGFIGSHIIDILSKNLINTFVYDKNSKEDKNNTFYINGDFSDLLHIEDTIVKNNITHIIHLISTTLPKNSNEDIPFDITSNVVQSIKIMDLCVKYEIKKFIFMSSGGTVYGIPQYLPMNEEHPTNPLCSYGITKLSIEKYLQIYHRLHGLNYSIIRAANPYGPRQNHLSGQGIIANFINKIEQQQALEIWGDGEIIRDYFDVRDLANLTFSVLTKDKNGIFNAGSGTGLSINEIVKLISSTTNKKPKIIYKEKRNFDIPSVILDISLTKEIFNWHPEINIRKGIEDYLYWYRKN